MTTTEKTIGLGDIDTRPQRLRALQPDVVKTLAASMAEVGLLQPIIVKRRGDAYWLIAGRHRIEAAKKLKWDAIRAVVIDGITADQAELAEIDENLCRADLSPAERALHIGRRKEIYEELHPETSNSAAAPATPNRRRRSTRWYGAGCARSS